MSVTPITPRVLLVEDEAGLRLTLSDRLGSEGYDVETASDGETGLARAVSGGYDLIVLDVMLPRMNGFDVCREARQRGVTAPILMLTARGQVVDKVVGLKLGADDYVTKPFALRELLARVGALLRRPRAAPAPLGFGEVTVDPATHGVTRRGARVPLRPKEYELLRALLRRAGRVATRSELLREVWGYQDCVVSRTLDTHVGELRRKLEDDPARPRHILTVRKTGYRLVGDDRTIGR